VVEDENFQRIDLPNNGRAASAHALLTPRTSNVMPQISPDGTRIVFESDRSGYEEIWMCNADGTNPIQLTQLERYAGSPRWSPDGRYIAFDFRAGEHTEIYLLEVGKGTPRQLVTSSDADNVVPSWSRDGKWVYFASNRGSRDFHIWKVPAAGGTPVQVTHGSGFMPFESLDGKSVYYSRLTKAGIWNVPVEGGAEKQVCDCTQPDDWANWTVAVNGLYFVDSKPGPLPQIKFIELASGKTFLVDKMEKPAFFGMTLSPDNKTLIYSQRDRDEHDILMTKLAQ
jgi:Tol biopolymer transport system component